MPITVCKFWLLKGIHIVVPRETIEGESGFILQTEKSVLFIIPWKYYWIIGTTDTKYDKIYVILLPLKKI